MNAAGPADILQKILLQKKQEIRANQQHRSLAELQQQLNSIGPTRGFLKAIEQRLQQDRVAVIAEIKRASPSKGLLRPSFDPAAIARDYADHGAQCLSVLTDGPFFQGDLSHLGEAREACRLPVLRKDFIIDDYQIYEARAAGADCILLIVAALSDAQMRQFSQLAIDLGMDVLVESHNQQELERALQCPAKLIGINNRNLHNFETRIETSLRLSELVPEDRIVVTESGIHSQAQVQQLVAHGIKAFLVGEAFMRAEQPGKMLQQLFAQREP